MDEFEMTFISLVLVPEKLNCLQWIWLVTVIWFSIGACIRAVTSQIIVIVEVVVMFHFSEPPVFEQADILHVDKQFMRSDSSRAFKPCFLPPLN